MAQHHRILNWQPDADYKKLPEHTPSRILKAAPLPRKTNVSPATLPIADQQSWGSCTANSSGRAVEVKMVELGIPLFRVARMAVYYWEREHFGSIRQDSGGTDTCAVQMMMKWGIPNEALWSYIAAHFAQKPAQQVYDEAAKHMLAGTMAARVKQDHDHIVAMLAAGNAIIGGFNVPTSFMGRQVQKTGVWAGPQKGDKIEGGHSVCITGHDDDDQTYIIDNSWGTSWGMQGRVKMPQSFWHSKQASDLIAIVNAPK